LAWLDIFRGIGKKLREGVGEFLSREGGMVPIGRGAGGDTTFPVDKWAEDIVIEALEDVHRRDVSFTLISEEAGVRRFGDGDSTVLVDPIDGSNNAKNGIPFFGTSIALLSGQTLATIAAGYVVNLATGDEFWALRGSGAFRNGSRLRTQETDSITIVAFEASDPGHDVQRIMPLLATAKRARCFGSTALDLAYLAGGAVSVFATATASRPFDFAAGALIVQEAGGIVTDLTGSPLEAVAAGLGRTFPLLAAKNRAAHAQALRILNAR
jgi:myo-inositol-1(or 4)-monophosphatase